MGEVLYFLHKHFRMTVVLALSASAVAIALIVVANLLRPATGT